MSSASLFLVVGPPIILLALLALALRSRIPPLPLLLALALGVLSPVIALGISEGLARPLLQPTALGELAAYVAFLIAIPEEFAKAIALVFAMLALGPRPRSGDVMILGAAAAAGFAISENISYLIIFASQGWEALVLARFLLPTPGHLAFGLAMGWVLAKAIRAESLWAKIPLAVATVPLPAFLHWCYDFPLFAADETPGMLIATYIGLPALALAALLKIMDLRRETKNDA